MSDEQPLPRLTDNGFPAGPHLYPLALDKIAKILELLRSLGDSDPANDESPIGTGGTITLFDLGDPEDEAHPPVFGWITQLDGPTCVFIPYIPEIEEDNGAAERHELAGRRRQYHEDRRALGEAGQPAAVRNLLRNPDYPAED